ncbi:hypothetical protein MBLNU13_g01631t1 [Cladosporium sp. NU13]
MSGFCEDDRKVAEYPKGIFGEPRDEKSPFIRCLQWASNIKDSERDIDLHSAKELIDTEHPNRLRVVLLTNCSQKTSGPDLEEFMKLYKHYSVPSEVLTERMRSVNHSFGSATAIGTDAEIAWFHFLCRQVEGSGRQAFTYLRNDQGGQNQSSGALSLWITCDFFLHVAKDKTVTLLCFGAPKGAIQRFEKLRENRFWEDALHEPYLLFAIIFDELHEMFDGLSKVLAVAIRKVEETAIKQARAPQQWSLMHGAQKNCTFMIETAEAIMSMLDAMQASLKDSPPPTSPSLRKSTERAIAYRQRTFKSTVLRVYSLEKRAQSIIQVYQALITQADSHAMKFIAVLTLIFLPVTGVATVFSSPFFNVDFDLDSTPLRVAQCFWKFWAVVAPLTFGTCLLCMLWFQFPADFSFWHPISSFREGWSVRNWAQSKKEKRARRKQGKLGV